MAVRPLLAFLVAAVALAAAAYVYGARERVLVDVRPNPGGSIFSRTVNVYDDRRPRWAAPAAVLIAFAGIGVAAAIIWPVLPARRAE